MDVVFNINPLGLEGLEASLSSLISHCADSNRLEMWFLCSDFKDIDTVNLKRLLISTGFQGNSNFVHYNSRKIFGQLRPLHGDWSVYGRLLIPDYIKSDTALYLDSDLVVSLDILTLENFAFDGKFLAAVHSSTIESTLDRHFFINRLHSPLKQGYFNSGVILFNLKLWRDNDIEKHWKMLAKKYSSELISHDQTLLNAVCNGNFAHLPSSFNNPWYPGEKMPNDSGTSIIHFVGSPKPWDLLGSVIHEGYETWNKYTTNDWKKKYSRMSISKIRRSWKLRRSILRHLKGFLFALFSLN